MERRRRLQQLGRVLMAAAGYAFTLTCPNDGAAIEHAASGTSTGWETRAVCYCTTCGAQILVAVTVAIDRRRTRG